MSVISDNTETIIDSVQSYTDRNRNTIFSPDTGTLNPDVNPNVSVVSDVFDYSQPIPEAPALHVTSSGSASSHFSDTLANHLTANSSREK